MFSIISLMAISFAIHEIDPQLPASLRIQKLSYQTDVDLKKIQHDFIEMKQVKSIADEYIEVKLYLFLKDYQKNLVTFSPESINKYPLTRSSFNFYDEHIRHALVIEKKFWSNLARWWQTFNRIYQPLMDEYCMSYSVEDKRTSVRRKIFSDFVKQFEKKGLFFSSSEEPSDIFHEVLLSRSAVEYKLSCYESNILNVIEIEQFGESNFKFYQRLLKKFAEIAHDNRRNNIKPIEGSYGLVVDFDDIRKESIDSFYSYMLD